MALAVLLLAWAGAARLGWGGGTWDAEEQHFGRCGEGPAAACVVDGDTLRIGERRIRLTGFDAPELDGACANESALALAAQAELVRWLALGPFQLDGGADPPRDQYGRELRAARRLSAAGDMQLLSDHMIGAGLAEGDYWGEGWSDDWGIGRQNWC